MGTIKLHEVFDEFILAGKFPGRNGRLCTASQVAAAIDVWRPALRGIMTGQRVAKLMSAHPWITRYDVSGREDRVRRYEYEINMDQLPSIRGRHQVGGSMLPVGMMQPQKLGIL